tara:strand:+ start:5702 stop:8074 length:2373 start_codon:yes stop_codon:yes gene_type:complete
MKRTAVDQDELEREMLTLGRDRVRLISNRQRQNKMESLGKWGEVLTAYGVDTVITHLRSIRRKIEKGRAGKSFALLTPITYLPPQQVAAASVRTIIDSLSSNPTLHSVAIDVAEKLWIETMLDWASKEELVRFNRGRSRKAHKMAAIRRMRRTENWEARERMASGAFMVELIARETGLIEIVIDKTYKPQRRVVRATEQCMAWINDVKTQQELMTPNYLPMYVKPRPWTTPLSGGYQNKKLPLSLLKSNSKLVAKNCDGTEPFITAANLHQGVARIVHTWMLEQIEHAYDLNLEIGCLLPRDGWPVPPYPKHLDEDDPGVYQWRIKAKTIHEKNEKTRGARIGIAKTLWVARRFKGEEELYFPVSLDFRGRIYYRPPYLNPQSNDVSRSLLLFANKTPITNEKELNWLRVHGANLYGLGKSDWQTRIDWTHEHDQLITGAGNDPWLNAEFWMRADKPWSFLAFCREYYLFRKHGWGYECGLGVMLDCTCSGIQHYAALLKSEEMGELVNLKHSDKPQDIYSSVMSRANKVLRLSDDPRAAKWLSLQPDRSLAKGPVMTTPYSATELSFYYSCYDWARKRAKKMFGNSSWTTRKGAMSTVHYMAQILHKEASVLIGPAVKAMEWFKLIGRRAGKRGTPLQWESPSGLLVHQEYANTRETRIRLKYLSDVHMDIRTRINQTGLDSKRMANALSANIIHSLDGSAMSFATIHAMMNGIQNIGGVHDCFSTTPAEMSQLRDSVRQSFSDMYSEDWLHHIKQRLLSQLPEEDLPPGPEPGELDISLVKTSNYFIT